MFISRSRNGPSAHLLHSCGEATSEDVSGWGEVNEEEEDDDEDEDDDDGSGEEEREILSSE